MATKETKFLVRDEDDYILATIAARNQLKEHRVTVSTTAVQLPASADALTTRRVLYIKNVQDPARIVYIGGSGVTTDDGFPLKQAEILQLDVAAAPAVYGITSSSGNVQVALLEVD